MYCILSEAEAHPASYFTQQEADRPPQSPTHLPQTTSSSATQPLAPVSEGPLWFNQTSSAETSTLPPTATTASQPLPGLDAFLYAAGPQAHSAQAHSLPAGVYPTGGTRSPYIEPQTTCAALPISPIYSESPFASVPGSSSTLGVSPTLTQAMPSSANNKRPRGDLESGLPAFSFPSPDANLLQASTDDMPFFVNAPMNRADRLDHLNQWEQDSSWAQLLSPEAAGPAFSSSLSRQHALVQKGVVTEESLLRYWWRFHEVCAYRVGWSNDGDTLQLALKESPLLVAAVCSIGARSLQIHSDATNALTEAKLYARNLVFYSDLRGTPADFLDLKGLLILSVYWSLPHIMSQSEFIVFDSVGKSN